MAFWYCADRCGHPSHGVTSDFWTCSGRKWPCFPLDEQPEFRWRAEAEEAARVLCPLHGRRFQTVVTRFLYRALHYYVADFERRKGRGTLRLNANSIYPEQSRLSRPKSGLLPIMKAA